MIRIGNDSNIRHKLAFMAVCVAINAAGNALSGNFQLPFWLDTIGTCLSACLLGPLWGGVTGLVTNLLVGITDFTMLLYGIVNVGTGVIIGFFARKNMCSEIFTAICVGIAAGAFSFICATPINCVYSDGFIGNRWGDALFTMLENYSISLPLRSACGQAFIDIPDKVISMLCAYFIIKFMHSQGLAGSSHTEEKE